MIKSILDTDLYKLTCQNLLINQLYRIGQTYSAKYVLYNRGKPLNLKAIERYLEYFADIRLTTEEYQYLDSLKIFNPLYLDFLKSYRFNPAEITISHDSLEINGDWAKTILWETPLMALISELNQDRIFTNDDVKRITPKWEKTTKYMNFFEFGTRRRHSYDYQSKVIESIKNLPNFLGTSNPHLAMKYGLKVSGTYPHEGPMGLQAIYPFHETTNEWNELWWNQYRFKPVPKIILPDALGTTYYLKHARKIHLEDFQGFRHDSGNPVEFVRKIIKTYQKHNINYQGKQIVFSNSLNPEKIISLTNSLTEFENLNFIAGVGTSLTSDIATPCNFVIKLDSINNKNVIKISDDPDKATGNPDVINKFLGK